MKKLFMLSSLAALAACVQIETLKTAQDVETSITCAKDEFSGITSCEMPLKSTCNDGTDVNMNCVGARVHSRLRLNHKDGKNAHFAISGYVWHSQMTYPKSALDSEGRKMDFEETDSVSQCTRYGCRYEEYFVITLDKSYLNQHKNKGLSIKIYGKRGNLRVEFPAHYVQGVLNYAQNNGIK